MSSLTPPVPLGAPCAKTYLWHLLVDSVYPLRWKMHCQAVLSWLEPERMVVGVRQTERGEGRWMDGWKEREIRKWRERQREREHWDTDHQNKPHKHTSQFYSYLPHQHPPISHSTHPITSNPISSDPILYIVYVLLKCSAVAVLRPQTTCVAIVQMMPTNPSPSIVSWCYPWSRRAFVPLSTHTDMVRWSEHMHWNDLGDGSGAIESTPDLIRLDPLRSHFIYQLHGYHDTS